jgi:hypothetical protein
MLKSESTIAQNMETLSRLQTILAAFPYHDVHESMLLICLIRIQLQQIAARTDSQETRIADVKPLFVLTAQIERLEGLKNRPTASREIEATLNMIFVLLWSMTGSIHRQISWHRPRHDADTVSGLMTAALNHAAIKATGSA